MDSRRLRRIILKLHDRLTNDDRKRLHFYLGTDVSRPIRVDSTLSGTLDLMDSLFDQDKINEEDFTLLINAFDEIRCYDAVKLLREHLRQNQSNGLNRSMESLSLIMPPMIDQLLQNQDEDKQAVEHLLINQQNICGHNNVMINSNNTNINRMPMPVSDQVTLRSISKGKRILGLSFASFVKCLLLLTILSIVGIGVLISFSVWNSIGIKQLKIKNHQFIELIEQLKTKNNQSIELDQQMKYLLKQLEYKRSSILISNIHRNTTWIHNGFTIAGGNESGNRLDQLFKPLGIYVDDDQTIYVADAGNNRILEWKCDASNGQVVAGGNGKGNQTNQLHWPTDVIVDKEKNNFIICDRGNRRIVRWSRRNGINGQTVILNVDCNGLTIDNNGHLYVSDFKKNEVRRWKMNDTVGTLVAGGNEKGNRLNNPNFIFVDENHSVYVSDQNNDRVMKWTKGAREGIVVAGGQGKGDGLTQVSGLQGLIVDQLGTVYVADSHNHRIMRWSKGATQGDIVVGGNGQGKEANQLNYPTGLSFDRQGNLYVIDQDNHRVQRFNID